MTISIVIVIGMVLCLAAIFVTTDMWLGDLVTAFSGEEEVEAGWPVVFAICAISGLGFSWLVTVLFS